MRFTLFFDGKNFFRALQKYDATLVIDYEKLAAWIGQELGDGPARFAGAYYYTGYSKEGGPAGTGFDKFLHALNYRRGYFVRREPRVPRKHTCKNCGHTTKYRTEKRVDTRLVADMIHLAAVDGYDTAVVFSGDQDLVPAVEAVAALGKQVFVATWAGRGLSKELRTRCFGALDLAAGRAQFDAGAAWPPGKPGGPSAVAAPPPSPATGSTAQVSAPVAPSSSTPVPPVAQLSQQYSIADLQSEVDDATKHFAKTGGRLSEWYFINKWQAKRTIAKAGQMRQAEVARAVASGALKKFTYTDSKGRLTDGLMT